MRGSAQAAAEAAAGPSRAEWSRNMDKRMEQNPILDATLSADDSIPLYLQLASLIRRCISSGLLKPGDQLPSEAELCQHFTISRSTVRQALKELDEQGLVLRRQGLGSFVAEPKLYRRSENIYSFTAEATAMGRKPGSKLLSFEIIRPSAEIRRLLEIRDENVEVYRFTRIRLVDGVPLMLETSYYPRYIYPELTQELLQTHSFYSLLFERGIVPGTATDVYEAIRLDRTEAELLETKASSAGFNHQRITRTEDGTVFELTQSVVRGDRTRLEVTLQRGGVSFARSFEN